LPTKIATRHGIFSTAVGPDGRFTRLGPISDDCLCDGGSAGSDGSTGRGITLAEKYWSKPTRTSQPHSPELCQKAGRFDILMRSAEERSDLVTYAASTRTHPPGAPGRWKDEGGG